MFFLKGTRSVRIKKYTVHDRQCSNCNDLDLTIKIYGSYYHVWFVPIVAMGLKSTEIQCNSCGKLIRWDSLAKEYESKTRLPFYLYTGIILIGVAILGGFGISLWGSHERAGYITQPQPGDVYLVKDHQPASDSYYFLRVMRVNGDSVIACHNNLIYNDYTPVFSPEDYFVADQEVAYTKALVKEMYDKDFIVTVQRDYSLQQTGFDRLEMH